MSDLPAPSSSMITLPNNKAELQKFRAKAYKRAKNAKKNGILFESSFNV